MRTTCKYIWEHESSLMALIFVDTLAVTDEHLGRLATDNSDKNGRDLTMRFISSSCRSLHVLFDKNLSKALQIVDKGGVFCFQGASSGRKVYHVREADEYILWMCKYNGVHQ